MNKEIRIDTTKQTEEELALANEQAQLIKTIQPQTHCADRDDEDEIIQLGLDSCGD